MYIILLCTIFDKSISVSPILFSHLSYCLTNEDTSQDTKWTKIQQRCLISERAGHCSNVSTPRAERNQRQSRRLKEVQLQNKKQQKQREREEQRKKDSIGSCNGGEEEEIQKVAANGEKENGGDTNVCDKRGREEKEIQTKVMVGRDGTKLKSRRSLQFPRNDVRTIKSPTVKITRISSHQRQSLGSFETIKSTGEQKMALQIRTSKASSSVTSNECFQQMASAKQGNERGLSRTLEKRDVTCTSPVKNRTTGTWSSSKGIPGAEVRQRTDSNVDLKVDGNSSMAMECPSSVSSPVSPTFAGNKQGVWPSPLRRSPRLKSKLADTKREGISVKGDDTRRKKADTEKKREKSLKAVSHQSCSCKCACHVGETVTITTPPKV